MKFTTILLTTAIASAALVAAAQTRGTAPPLQDQSIVTAEASPRAPTDANAKGTEFLADALRASLAGARMGELAAQQSSDQRVRDYGTKLKSDFASHASEIQQMLTPLDVPIPTQLSAEAISQLAALTRLSGKEFDSAFVQAAIRMHDDAIEQYGAQTHANPDRQLSEFATRSLPMLREHLAQAQTLL
jgi:putative membrane protein